MAARIELLLNGGHRRRVRNHDVGDIIDAASLEQGRRHVGGVAEDADFRLRPQHSPDQGNLLQAGENDGHVQGGGNALLMVPKEAAAPDDGSDALALQLLAALDQHVGHGGVGVLDLH